MPNLALNRPVHLAGRDAHFEHAVKLLRADLMNYDVADRFEKCRLITSVLQSSAEHSDFALRGADGCKEEELFARFVGVLLDSAQSLLSMTKHEQMLATDRVLVREFLGKEVELLDRSAAEHRQLAQNILRETIALIEMSADSFRKLKEKNLADLDAEESRKRYQRAYESFQRQITS